MSGISDDGVSPRVSTCHDADKICYYVVLGVSTLFFVASVASVLIIYSLSYPLNASLQFLILTVAGIFITSTASSFLLLYRKKYRYADEESEESDPSVELVSVPQRPCTIHSNVVGPFSGQTVTPPPSYDDSQNYFMHNYQNYPFFSARHPVCQELLFEQIHHMRRPLPILPTNHPVLQSRNPMSSAIPNRTNVVERMPSDSLEHICPVVSHSSNSRNTLSSAIPNRTTVAESNSSGLFEPIWPIVSHSSNSRNALASVIPNLTTVAESNSSGPFEPIKPIVSNYSNSINAPVSAMPNRAIVGERIDFAPLEPIHSIAWPFKNSRNAMTSAISNLKIVAGRSHSAPLDVAISRKPNSTCRTPTTSIRSRSIPLNTSFSVKQPCGDSDVPVTSETSGVVFTGARPKEFRRNKDLKIEDKASKTDSGLFVRLNGIKNSDGNSQIIEPTNSFSSFLPNGSRNIKLLHSDLKNDSIHESKNYTHLRQKHYPTNHPDTIEQTRKISLPVEKDGSKSSSNCPSSM